MKAFLNCIDCHMPRIVKSAVGDAAKWSGDIRTHFFVIDPEADEQFSEDGKTAISQITLDWACKSCHGAEGSYSQRTDEELYEEAKGYHQES
jgi:mono/diheme cytochrome c family protein